MLQKGDIYACFLEWTCCFDAWRSLPLGWWRRVGGGSVAAEEAGKTHYVAAGQAGGKESVEPAYAGCDYLYHVAYVDHREEGAGTDHLPLPCAEEEVAGGDGECHQQYVYGYFHHGEGFACDAADGYGYAFAGHGHGLAFDLEGYAYAHHGAACCLYDCLGGKGGAFEGLQQDHVKVDEPSENEPYHKLEQLHQLEAAPQHQYLASHQKEVHENSVGADCPGGCHACLACE